MPDGKGHRGEIKRPRRLKAKVIYRNLADTRRECSEAQQGVELFNRSHVNTENQTDINGNIISSSTVSRFIAAYGFAMKESAPESETLELATEIRVDGIGAVA
jgi:hypothetical protein